MNRQDDTKKTDRQTSLTHSFIHSLTHSLTHSTPLYSTSSGPQLQVCIGKNITSFTTTPRTARARFFSPRHHPVTTRPSHFCNNSTAPTTNPIRQAPLLTLPCPRQSTPRTVCHLLSGRRAPRRAIVPRPDHSNSINAYILVRVR